MIYKGNKRSIVLTKSFQKLAENKYSLKAGLITAIDGQIYITKRATIGKVTALVE